LSTVAEALLAARATLFGQCQQLQKRLRSPAREDDRVRLLLTAPGVGAIVALNYASPIDDPSGFRSSKTVGAHFGLTPKKSQWGETDITGRISKIGDGGVRWHAQDQGGAHPQARRGSASCAGRRDELPR
jgi:transposase